MYISFAASAAILIVLFLPTASGSVISLSTAIASPDGDQPPCQALEHVKEGKHSYDVIYALCAGEKPPKPSQ